MHWSTHTLFGIAAAAAAVALVSDVRERRIPNWVTVPTALLGLVLNASWSWGLELGESSLASSLFAQSLMGFGLLFVFFVVLGLAGVLGMGDAKLLAAIGACIRWPAALHLVVYVFLAGGLLSLGAWFRQRGKAGGKTEKGLHRLPYGIAIFAGLLWLWLAAATGIGRLL